MSKKFIAVFVIFLCSAAGLIYVKISYFNLPNLNSLKSKTLFKKETSTVTSLSIIPTSIIITASQSASVNVVAEGLKQKTNSLIQFELYYDPNSIQITNILPGDIFTNPDVILNNINPRTGRISYAIRGKTNIYSASATAAVINFATTSYNFRKESEIKFLPKTLVRSNEEKIKISSMSGTRIIIKQLFIPNISTPSASISR